MKYILILLTIASVRAQTPAQFKAIQSRVAALQQQVIALQQNNALKLAPFVTVNPNPEANVSGPNITFHGANIHIVNGMNATQLINGLGNLIIGYDEDPSQSPSFNFPTQVALPFSGQVVALQSGDRGGSHNLVIGRWHKFTRTAFGGLLAGELNEIQNEADSITGGLLNVTHPAGQWATITGGAMNTTGAGQLSTILGGEFNGTGGATFCTVVGGYSNHAQGYYAVTLGGQNNICNSELSVVLGPVQP